MRSNPAPETAKFWIELDDSILYICYFTVQDAKNFFHGSREVSQEVTEIRKLERQWRLLDWEYWDGRLLFRE